MTRVTARRTYLAAAAALALAIAVSQWPGQQNELDTAAAPTTDQGPMAAEASAVTAPPTAPEPEPEATRFTRAARLLELGVAGDLTVDAQTRGALDVMMAMLGNPPSATELQALEEELRRAMPGEAATQAIALVRHYAAYTEAAASEALKPPTTAAELGAMIEKTAALRREHFDAVTAQALFGAEEEISRHTLAVQNIEADTTLSPQEKAKRLAALRAELPAEAAALAPRQSLAMNELEDKLDRLKLQGAGPDQIAQLREQYIGRDAAASLGETESQRDSWAARYAAFAQQRNAVVASGAADRAAQEDTLLRQHFTDEELASARAYDHAQQR